MSQNIKRIAVFTSGGDAPGMNAAIRAVVRTATFHDLHIYGIDRGYEGMIKGDIRRLETADVGNIIHRGGTILKTARSKAFMTKEGRQQACESLRAHDIDACVAIGGNGTLAGAEAFMKEHKIPFVGLPGTIDNDLFGTDCTIGYDTALNTAIDAVDKIRDTADSHNRIFFIEVMGRDSGFIALHTGIGSGAGNVLIPETDTDLKSLINQFKKGIRRKKLFSLIIVAEGNKNGNASKIAEEVQKNLPDHDVRVTIIGHLQRGGSPSCFDRVLSSRLGHAAVEGLITGKKGVMVGIVNNKITFTKFKDAINRKKEPMEDMIRIAEILSM
ncbi:MAG: 6-phosphofructokinase [Bacteroidota bacterium]